tara:strand:+ start:350 stop:883 length:534 start_codon:yes stop_codon:yes gene_type:complete
MIKKRAEFKYKPAPTDKLSDRAKELCRQLVSGQTPPDAARLAGYSESWAKSQSYGYVQKPLMRTYVEILKNKQIERTAVDPDFVIKTLARLIDKAETDGKYTDAIKATELLGKHYQMFKDVSKQEIELSGKNNPFSTGTTDVARKAAMTRLIKVTGIQNKVQDNLDEKEAADDEAIN